MSEKEATDRSFFPTGGLGRVQYDNWLAHPDQKRYRRALEEGNADRMRKYYFTMEAQDVETSIECMRRKGLNDLDLVGFYKELAREQYKQVNYDELAVDRVEIKADGTTTIWGSLIFSIGELERLKEVAIATPPLRG